MSTGDNSEYRCVQLFIVYTGVWGVLGYIRVHTGFFKCIQVCTVGHSIYRCTQGYTCVNRLLWCIQVSQMSTGDKGVHRCLGYIQCV